MPSEQIVARCLNLMPTLSRIVARHIRRPTTGEPDNTLRAVVRHMARAYGLDKGFAWKVTPRARRIGGYVYRVEFGWGQDKGTFSIDVPKDLYRNQLLVRALRDPAELTDLVAGCYARWGVVEDNLVQSQLGLWLAHTLECHWAEFRISRQNDSNSDAVLVRIEIEKPIEQEIQLRITHEDVRRASFRQVRDPGR